METSRTKLISLSSSDDEENQERMPKILNTISLQGCKEFAFQDDTKDEQVGDILYPECVIKEELSADEEHLKGRDVLKQNGHASDSKRKGEEKQVKKEKKRVNLTQITSVEHDSRKKPKPSTSRQDETYNVVDARKLALQESLFKTKELFDTFLRVCQDQIRPERDTRDKSSEQMEKVVQKLSRAYGQANQEYLGGLKFQNILEEETEKVNTSTDKPWLNLKLVLDEMKFNKKGARSKLKLGESEESQDGGGSNDDEPVIECPKKRRHLKKLEKFLRALNLKIKNLEEREVDLNDDDSAYIKLDRYRSQFTKCYNKICEIKGKLSDADRPYLRKVSFAGTTYPHINRCIERYYNRHREFPDFQDIKKLVTIANEQENIQMAPVKVQQMAADAFKEFGEMLKRLRQYDDYDVIISYLDQQVDPARDDEALQEQLNKNALLFKKKEQEVIDRFAAADAGIQSESNDDSDSKPKKKKRKIITTAPRIKPSTPVKKHLSSSDDSDNNEENEVRSVKKQTPGPTLSSSDSESEAEKTIRKEKVIVIKKEPVEGKGKSLIGKKRVVKRGPNHSTPKKLAKPVLSSDDEASTSKDPKDNFTNYLGLQVTPLKIQTKEKRIKEETDDDDEVTYVQEIRRSPLENNVQKSYNAKISSDSDSSVEAKPLSAAKTVKKPNSNDLSDEKPRRPTKKTEDVVNTIDDSNSDSDSDIEPIAVVEKTVNSIPKTEEKPKRVEKRKSSDSLKKLVLSSNSDESDNRTSDEESGKKSASDVSDVELSTGTKDLSSDSSDSEDKKRGKEASQDTDDAIVILSEDVTEVTPVNNRSKSSSSSQKSSDSEDDVCIVSQESSEKRTIAPRRTKVEEKPNNSYRPCPLSRKNVQRPLSSAAPSIPVPRRRIVAATSIPVHRPAVAVKRRLSPQSNSIKRVKRSGSSSDSGSGSGSRQMTLPQIINGAARKTIISRVCRPKNSPDSIPLIELD